MYSSSSVPVVIKSGIGKKDILICESHDEEINFTGNSGAVGRLAVEDNELVMDLQGRKYSGTIMSGPLIMVLNVMPFVAKKKKDNDKDKEGIEGNGAAGVGAEVDVRAVGSPAPPAFGGVARVEVISNEFCRLDFQQDMLSSLKGEFTGDRGYICDGDDNGVRAMSGNAPKISTITTKKRVAKSGKRKLVAKKAKK